ncbi:MAG: hypothetical protein M1320_00645 [Patescibacteria group bacterium]|nr:hypothetical protein [Patescibacteria group bacterium]
MENKEYALRTKVHVGCFDVSPENVVIIDIKPNLYKSTINERILGFIEELDSKHVSITQLVQNLESQGKRVDEKIRKLISSGFFKKDFGDALREIFSSIVIIKGRATWNRSPYVLMRDGFPADFYLIPRDTLFHVAYIVSQILSKEFLNIHLIDRVFLMSDPLDKLDEHDDHRIVKWDPDSSLIGTALYDNPYSGDQNAGYLFFA